MKHKYEHNIDKLFHESLDGHNIEPKPALWKSLSANVPGRSGSNTLVFLAAALVLALLSAMLNYQLHDYHGIQKKAKQQEINTLMPVTEESTEEQTNHPIEVDQTDNTDDTQLTEKPITAIETAPAAGLPKTESTGRAQEYTAKAEHPGQQNINIDINRSEYSRIESISLQNQIYNDNASPSILDSEDAKISPVFNMGMENQYVKNAKLLLGAAFSPAVNIYPDGQNRNDFSFEIIAVYENSRFFAEGGFGANYATESAKYGINYSTYDSVGYFINVDAFTLDPENPGTIRFHTSMKNIYDSISHYKIKENTNKYAYLQIPLRIGYRIIDNGRFSLDVKAGILFSWQIMKDVPDLPYEGSDDSQIDVIRYYPDRLKTNWQYTAGVGINYHISNNLRIGIDPFYRQYIKSVYAPDSKYSARSPYAFGVRGGIYIEF